MYDYSELISPVKLTKEQQDHLVADACREWTTWTDMIQDIRDRAYESRQMYYENRPWRMGYDSPEGAFENSSNVRRPITAQTIDSIHAQQHLSSFPLDENFFTLRPKNDVSRAKKEAYETYRSDNLAQIDFMVNVFNDRKNLLLDGTSAVWVPFERKVRRRAEYQFKQLNLMGFSIPLAEAPKKIYKEAVEWEATRFIPLMFDDWRVDPTIDCMEDTPFLWRRWVSEHDLKDAKDLINTDDLVPFKRFLDDHQSQIDDIYELMGIEKKAFEEEAKSDTAKQMVLVVEKWGDFVIDGKLYENHFLVFSNHYTFHYFGPNPYDHGKKPFLVSAYVPQPGTLYGKNAVADVIPIQHAMDGLLNITIDMLRGAIPFYLYNANDKSLFTFFKDGKQAVAPGEFVPFSMPGSLVPMAVNIQGLDFVSGLMQVLKEEFRESTGGLPYATGGISNSDQERTATETSILASGTNTRFQNLIQFYEEMKLKPFLDMCFENDRQYISEPIIVDGQTEMITPAIMKQMDYKIDITGSKSVMTRNQEAANTKEFVMGIVPQLIQNGIIRPSGDILEADLPEMIYAMAATMNIRNAKDILKQVSKDELMKEMEAQQQEVQAQGGLGQLPPEMINGPQGIQEPALNGPNIDLGAP